ncbi:MFS transporter [Marinobacterium rhizophilum]|uniref:MFS transporter n=1 Tax=Marinobacterium rhizophilum TaxID=420402 RepID=A0ABY5HGR9_9GAMM|nr:MFS transporter [Marinobacterium rhizophilum]UTW11485.1 MFS transporter [Marinobacterium rhizophilum]
MSPSILSERNYLTYLCGSLFSTQGVWIQRMTLGWMMWDLTGSETWLGLLAFLMFFPVVLVGPLFGVLVDRINRRRAAVAISLLLSGLGGTLAALVWGGLIEPLGLLLFALVIGMTNSAYQAVRLSLVPELVSVVNMSRAVAINAILFNSARFIGPMIAGVLINLYGGAMALAVSGACYLPLTLVLSQLRLDEKARRGGAEQRRFLADLLAGVRYARSEALILRLLLVIGCSAILGRGLLEILPAAVDVLYHRGVEALAMLTSAAGLGSIVAGLILSAQSQARLLPALGLAAPGAGLVLMLFGLNTHFEVAVVLVMLLSFCATVCGVATQSLIQVSLDRAYRGRVMSLWGALNVGGGAVGGLLFGLVTEHAGYGLTLVLLGALNILLARFATRGLGAPEPGH